MKIAIDHDRIGKIASLLGSGAFEPFSFTEPAGTYPPLNHPRTIEYFFSVVMHQYGFWEADENGRWRNSMFGFVGGARLKGSDFVWRAATRDLLAGKESLTDFLGDDGACPLPMLETHHAISREFEAWRSARSLSLIVKEANRSPDPVASLLDVLKGVPGYREDPFQKKAMLLAMTLAQRPEHFLRATPSSAWGPVVDYHVQRTALRTGIVRPAIELREKLESRMSLESSEELAVRTATFDAVNELSRISNVGHGAIDLLFFQARSRCPETTEPDCAQCPLDSACAKEKTLFQPVFRTTAY